MPSESEIISLLKKYKPKSDGVIVGIGDDAAVIKGAGGNDLIACCDLMIEGVHFRSDWSPPRLLGHKALAVNLSDVAAMGGVPKFAMISIALPHKLSLGFIEELFAGMHDLADACGVSVIGGDTSSSPNSIFIDVSVIGECESGRAVTRRGAKTGDTIYVSGSLGASAVGLSLLEQGLKLDDYHNEPEPIRAALMKHLAPEPRLKLGRAMGEAGLATSMIDISDGLSTDLFHLVNESRCAAVIHAAAIPIADCVRSIGGSKVDPIRQALGSGEEYELLFTARPDNKQQVEDVARASGVTITAIGEIIGGNGLLLEREGEFESVEPTGYEHKI